MMMRQQLDNASLLAAQAQLANASMLSNPAQAREVVDDLCAVSPWLTSTNTYQTNVNNLVQTTLEQESQPQSQPQPQSQLQPKPQPQGPTPPQQLYPSASNINILSRSQTQGNEALELLPIDIVESCFMV